MPSILTRQFGFKPSGPEGTWRRRDHLKAAGLNVCVALALMGVFYLDVWRGGGKFGIVGLAAVLLMLFTLLATLVRLLFAAIGKRR